MKAGLSDWQSDYRKKLLKGGKTFTIKEQSRLKSETKSADKRTYNGRMTKIFNDARLSVVDDVIKEKRWNARPSEKKNCKRREKIMNVQAKDRYGRTNSQVAQHLSALKDRKKKLRNDLISQDRRIKDCEEDINLMLKNNTKWNNLKRNKF